MKEPQKFRMNPETPTHKDVKKFPLPSMYKPEWDLAGDSGETYIPAPKNIGKSNEDNSENNSESIQ